MLSFSSDGLTERIVVVISLAFSKTELSLELDETTDDETPKVTVAVGTAAGIPIYL